MPTNSTAAPTPSASTNAGPPLAPPPAPPSTPGAPAGAAAGLRGWLRSTLASLFASKKFLVMFAAGLVAVVRLIATTAGVTIDQDALDRIFLALLSYVGAQGITDVGKGAQQVKAGAVVASFQSALSELLHSKKFLTAAAGAFVAAAAPLARRLGIELDATSMDRLFVGILTYVGVQGITDFGKGSAQVTAGGAVSAVPPAISKTPQVSPVTGNAGGPGTIDPH